jgi:hypothetical protein
MELTQERTQAEWAAMGQEGMTPVVLEYLTRHEAPPPELHAAWTADLRVNGTTYTEDPQVREAWIQSLHPATQRSIREYQRNYPQEG